VIAALLLGLASAGPPAPVEQHRQTVFVGWDATTKACVPEVNGVATGDIATEDGKKALVAALPDKGETIRIAAKGGLDIGWSCTSGIVDTLRHAGFYGRIGTLAQP
jgi:hypothetical protein